MEENRLDLAIADWMQRALKDELLDKVEFLKAHPEVARDLARALEELTQVHSAQEDDVNEFAALIHALSRQRRIPPPVPGIAIPNHEILSWIGGGSFGDVWLARHEVIDQKRAIKIVPLRSCKPERVERVLDEARIMAALGKHSNRVMIFDAFMEGENLVLILEYVPGGSLNTRTSRNAALPWESACKYTGQVAAGLADLHQRGVLHRDIKPANIFLDEEGDQALLGDFGLAVEFRCSPSISGTAGYTAPEVMMGQVTTKCDVFSLAASLFHLVVGQAPFDSRDLLISLEQAAGGLLSPVPALSHLPKAVEELILAGLEPDSDARVTLMEFQERLSGVHIAVVTDRLVHLSSPFSRGARLYEYIRVDKKTEGSRLPPCGKSTPSLRL